MFNESIFGTQAGLPTTPMEPSGPPAVGREGIGRRSNKSLSLWNSLQILRRYGLAEADVLADSKGSPHSTSERQSDVEGEKQNEEQEDQNAKKTSVHGTGHCRA